MLIHLNCIPCFVRQALDAARLATDDVRVHENVLRQVLAMAADMDMQQSPPAIGEHIHRIIRKTTGSDDPYSAVKEKSNRLARGLCRELRAVIQADDEPLNVAIRLAIAGNLIDFGTRSNVEDSDVKRVIDTAMDYPFDEAEYEDFRRAVDSARRIMYIGDNAGEIFFDRLLIEQLPRRNVTYVVRGRAVLNDVTIADAQAAGLCDIVEVIDNGSDAPGTVLDSCSPEFRRRLDQANMVISKGQGNYESLSHERPDAFFLLIAKCAVIAESIGCRVGDLIFRRSPAYRPYGDAPRPSARPDEDYAVNTE